MKRLAMIATLVAMLGILLAAATASARQERDEIMLVIPMNYMSATMAARIFGGQVIDASPLIGQNRFGNRGTSGYASGSYQSGTSIGGGYDRSARGGSEFGRNNTYPR